MDVPSELTDKLDDCLANAMAAKASGTHDGVDLLVTGLPGSGKTGITKQWASDRGVNLFYLNAKNDDLGAILNGFPIEISPSFARMKIGSALPIISETRPPNSVSHLFSAIRYMQSRSADASPRRRTDVKRTNSSLKCLTALSISLPASGSRGL